MPEPIAIPNPHVFRTYDVRGVAGTDLTEPFARALGQSYALAILAGDADASAVALCRDPRPHGEGLKAAFSEGVRAAGLDVLDVGVGPSPYLYFAAHHLGTAGAVQVTGSHNPKDYNGFKMMRGTGSFWGDAIVDLKRRLCEGDLAEAATPGSVAPRDVQAEYVDALVEHLEWPADARPLKVVLDAGHGAGGPLGLALLERLGVETIPLFCTMDGTFPAHHPDPTVEANLEDLKRAVAESGADCGLAFDGDADRLGVVDGVGNVLWGDRLLVLYARQILAEHPGAKVVGEVKCSKTLFDAIAAAGGEPILSAVGHSIIKDRMKREGALLAGEMSGHLFFKHRWFGFDDALYASGRLLEILAGTAEPLSTLLADLPETFVTPEIRLDCPDALKFRVVEAAVFHYKALYPDGVVDIDGVRVTVPGGWGLIRASNTQPVIVMRAEADSPERLAELRGELEAFVADTSARLTAEGA